MIIPIEDSKELEMWRDKIGEEIDIGLGFRFRVKRILEIPMDYGAIDYAVVLEELSAEEREES